MWTTDVGGVLIITARHDVTSDFVIAELDEMGVPVIRMDMADVPDTAQITARLNGSSWTGQITVGRRVMRIEEITGIYYRRPSMPQITGLGSPSRDRFIEKEILLGFGGLLEALPEDLWLGHPRTLLAVQKSKPRQLSLAVEVGLSVPETIVTGTTAEAAAFADTVGPVAVKSFGIASFLGPDNEEQAIHTRRLTAGDIRASDLAGIPHQVQRWIDATHAVRLAVVDEQLFAAEVHFGSSATRLDWRADAESLTYKRVEPLAEVAGGVRRLMRTLGLRFGALDFMVDAAGVWWFLEINANGQWAWISEVSGEIAKAIAKALIGPAARSALHEDRVLVG